MGRGPLRSRISRAVVLAGIVWAASVVAVYAALVRHQGDPGPVAAAPPRLAPGEGGAVPGTHTLLVFAHPKCPCTRATLRELERILAQATVPLRVVVHLYRPHGESDAWTHGALLDGARALRAEVRVDPDGATARRFGALTSGYALLYGPAGELRFSGGVTPGRAHEGTSAGELALAELLRGRNASIDRAPVFGCSIHGPHDAAPTGSVSGESA